MNMLLVIMIIKGVNQMNNNECCGNENCIADILKVILILQKNADCGECCLDTCDRGFLGCGTTPCLCNTRPVMLYTCCGNGLPWTMPTTKENVICGTEGVTCSSVFRIEKLDGNCATFRVLAANPDATSPNPYVTTNSFFTMNLSCSCVIRCLNDTYVECL